MPVDTATQGFALEHLLTNADEGILAISRNHDVVLFNKGCERITGFAASEMIGQTEDSAEVAALTDGRRRTLTGAMSSADSIFAGTTRTARQRIELNRRDGRMASVDAFFTGLHNGSGNVEFVLGIMRDIPEATIPGTGSISDLGALRERVRKLAEANGTPVGSVFVAESSAMETVIQTIRTASRSDSPVLLTGESGVGKRTIARLIHATGAQAAGPFTEWNCSTLSPSALDAELFSPEGGLRADATGGTLYLDDITAMTPETQLRLAGVLQSRRTPQGGGNGRAHVRVIAASLLTPDEILTQNLVRRDLFYSLAVIGIDVPPLRKRSGDIPLLVASIVERSHAGRGRQVTTVAEDAWRAIARYAWPGNLRELENVLDVAIATGEGATLRFEDLPPTVRGLRGLQPAEGRMDSLRLDSHLEQVERAAILHALEAAGWQRNKAAEMMGISRSRLYRRMEALAIDPNARP